MNEIFFEAESLGNLGGWIVDSSMMETIHSSFIMAHGMGIPVHDAEGTFSADADAVYNVWVLTRNWTAVWQGAECIGKFNLRIDETNLPETLGTAGAAWSWQKAGEIFLKKGLHTVSLHDLTGFNARCDAVYMTDSDEAPPNDIHGTDSLRKRLGWHSIEESADDYDLIVAGGGIAGICTALAALRAGMRTLLVSDRGVLGGCNSSEIRVCMGGIVNLPPYRNIGNVVKEIAPVMGDPSIFDAAYFEDFRKSAAFEASGNKTAVLLNECVTDAETSDGKITSIVCTNTLSGKKTRYRASLFADCTGDAVLARLAGAETMYGREAKSEFGESLAPKQHEKLVMGHSIRWYSEDTGRKSEFPDIKLGINFSDETCLNVFNGDWEQESGFRRDMIHEAEYIRDYGLAAIYSNWAYQKNHFKDKEKFADYALKWVSPIGGKRESYRVKGEHIMTQNDIENHVMYDDGTACITWSIDLHFPEIDNDRQFSEPFRSFAYHRGIEKPYPVPYRCLYSKDIKNLFIGGRAVSATHVAFSSVRVMRTLGSLGEAAGLAAALCTEKSCLPADVYHKYLTEYKKLLSKGADIPQTFSGKVENEEAYHFKDIGWLYLNKKFSTPKENIPKFKRGIETLGLTHKYPMPDELK